MQKTIKTLTDLEDFVQEFLHAHPEGAVVGLSGELGAGKTTFVRMCIKFLAQRKGIEVPRVTSPTFVLHQRYPNLAQAVEHFDLYRLDAISQESLTELGYFDALDFVREVHGFLFVEWPEKAKECESLGLDQHIVFSFDGEVRVVEVKR